MVVRGRCGANEARPWSNLTQRAAGGGRGGAEEANSRGATACCVRGVRVLFHSWRRRAVTPDPCPNFFGEWPVRAVILDNAIVVKRNRPSCFVPACKEGYGLSPPTDHALTNPCVSFLRAMQVPSTFYNEPVVLSSPFLADAGAVNFSRPSCVD